MTDSTVDVRVVSWDQARVGASAVRERVFVHEQHVPLELEWDGLDPQCVHVIARNRNDEVIGTARMLADGHIGRMAVVPAWRGRGVGSALLRALLEEAHRRGIEQPFLHAQTAAVGFYRRHGFAIVGREFMDAGIAHVAMVWNEGPGHAPGS
jgi:predicted GNAT family N-acyltransferase